MKFIGIIVVNFMELLDGFKKIKEKSSSYNFFPSKEIFQQLHLETITIPKKEFNDEIVSFARKKVFCFEKKEDMSNPIPRYVFLVYEHNDSVLLGIDDGDIFILFEAEFDVYKKEIENLFGVYEEPENIISKTFEVFSYDDKKFVVLSCKNKFLENCVI